MRTNRVKDHENGVRNHDAKSKPGTVFLSATSKSSPDHVHQKFTHPVHLHPRSTLPDSVYTLVIVIYEWDESKRTTNRAKHGLDFADADMVLESPYVLIVDSPRKSEARKQAIAYVFDALAVLSVVFAAGEDRCRIVSFRPANRRERKTYHAWLEENGPDDPDDPNDPNDPNDQ